MVLACLIMRFVIVTGMVMLVVIVVVAMPATTGKRSQDRPRS
jgi:hypothetical protein